MLVEEALAIVEAALAPKQLSKLQKTIFCQVWEEQSYLKIARNFGYGEDYIKRTGSELWQLLSQAFGERVSKSTLRAVVAAYKHRIQIEQQPIQAIQPKVSSAQLDWSEAADASIFYGRTVELATLKQWIIQDQCRLIALLGMGGMGKTLLASRLGGQIQQKFDFAVWRSLRDAPSVEEIVVGLIRFLTKQQGNDLPKSLDGLLSLLTRQLIQHRCLIVLDNVESILRAGERAGQYRDGFNGYGSLIRRVGESLHQSCLLLTSREKPREVYLLEGRTRPVRCLQLSGLAQPDGQKILEVEGISGTEAEQQALLSRYAGNPLAVKIAAMTIQELFCGSISAFLAQDIGIFGDICDLLDQQFGRLSSLGKAVMYWLAINREAISVSELREDFVLPITLQKLIETIGSLERRSLLERSVAGFTLQTVVMEYTTNRLIEQIIQEIQSGKLELFNQYALIKATAKDYIRETQTRLILKLIVEQIVDSECLTKLLQTIRCDLELAGYAAGNLLNLLCHLYEIVEGYDFSRLTLRQVYLKGANLHHVDFTSSHFIQPVLTHPFGNVLAVAFSPDGSLLATGNSDGEVCLWQAKNGQFLTSYQGHTSWVRAIAFSPDGRLLASGGEDQVIRLWDLHTQECRYVFQGHTVWIWSLAFSPDGQLLISSSDDQTIRVWDLSTYECRHNFENCTSQVWSIAISPDSKMLASGGDDQAVRIWDLETYECLHILHGHTNWVRSVAFSSDGRLLASSGDQTVRLWDLNSHQCVHVFQGHRQSVWSVAFSPDGQMLVSGGEDQTVRLWDLSTRHCLHVFEGHQNRIWSVAVSPDGKTVASSSDDQTVRLWDLNSHQSLHTLQGYRNPTWSVAFSPDGKSLAAGGDQMIRLWDLSSHECLHTLQGHKNRIWSVAFSPDGQILASGSEDHTVRLWNLKTRECLHTCYDYASWVWSVAFSPDGQILASGSEDGTIRLWDLQSREYLQIIYGHTNWVRSVRFSPNGQLLASSDAHQTIRLWDSSTYECLQIFAGHSHSISSVAFSPDGRLLASASEDPNVQLWDLKTGQSLHRFTGYTGQVWSVAFSSDGKLLATGSDDQTVRVWDLTDYQCLYVFREHTNWVRSVAFSPDGKALASGSADETIKLWDILKGECMVTLKTPKPYEGTKITDATGLTEAQKISLLSLGAIEEP